MISTPCAHALHVISLESTIQGLWRREDSAYHYVSPYRAFAPDGREGRFKIYGRVLSGQVTI